MTLDELVYAAKVQCHLDSDDVVTRLLLLTRFSVIALALLMFFASLKYKEIYLLFLSIALKLNIFLNELLSDVIIKQSAPSIDCNNDNPALVVMGHEMNVYGMPSFIAQHVYFFITVSLTYALLWRVRLSFLTLLALLGYAALACTAQVVLLYNTAWQVVVGAAVGIVFGVLYQAFIYYALSPYFEWIVSTRVFSYFEYRDGMCSTVSRFELYGNLSDARCYFELVIWPLLLQKLAPHFGSLEPVDVDQIRRKLENSIEKVYTQSDNKNKER